MHLFNNISLGILSWNSRKVLIRTLENYKKHNLFSLFGESVIFFNEIDTADRYIAKKYGLKCYGASKNLGIFEGTSALVDNLKNEYILLLQNDNPITRTKMPPIRQIRDALNLLEQGKIDIMRLRHRWRVGEKFWDVNKYLKLYNAVNVDENFLPDEHKPPINNKNLHASFKFGFLRFLRKKDYIGKSLYIEKEPEKLFPKYIQKDGDIFIVDSSVINYTEQPILMKKNLFLQIKEYCEKHPSKRTVNGMQVFEIILGDKWWKKQHFKIGVGEGIFTHNRY